MREKTWSIGIVARDIDVDRTTIYNWMKHEELVKFFTDGALGKGKGRNRKFTRSDADVLNTISKLRASGTIDWDEIVAVLEEGTRITQYSDDPLSDDGRVISVQHAEVAIQVKELQIKLEEVNRVVEEKDKIIANKDTELDKKDEIIADLQGKISELYERLTGLKDNADIRELERTIGRLEAKIEFLSEDK